MRTAASALSGLLAVMSLAYPFVDVLAGRNGHQRILAALPSVVIFGAVWAISRRANGRRHPQALLFAIAIGCLLGIELHASVDRDGYADLTPTIGVIPLIVTAFVPWRPTLSLLLALPTMLLIAGRHRWWGSGAMAAPIEQEVFIVVCLGALSALASQVQRRVWRELEITRTRANLLTVDRMASLGRLTAGIAHELKTPVAAALHGAQGARNLVHELRESVGHPDVEDADLRAIAAELDDTLGGIRGDVERCARYVHAIRDQTRSMNEIDGVEVSIADRVESVRALLAHRIRKSRVALEVAVAPDLTVYGDPGKLDQILTNLISNAFDACEAHPAASKISVNASRRAGGVLVTVTDDGPGVPAALRERVFEMLFTTRGRDGTGLGLAISRDIAEGAFGGTLELVPSDTGARFQLFCPDGGVAPSRVAAWRPFARSA